MAFTIHAADPARLHRQLAQLNQLSAAAARHLPPWRQQRDTEFATRVHERLFLESLRREVTPMLPLEVQDADGFLAWLGTLAHVGPGQQHPLFGWLAASASLDQLLWFLNQESAAEPGADRMVDALQAVVPTLTAQVRMQVMRAISAHGMMHGRLRQRILPGESDPAPHDAIAWEALATNNLLHGLSRNPRYFYQAIGAVAALEVATPQRLKSIAAGMSRLGLQPRMRPAAPQAVLDRPGEARESGPEDWRQNVIRPLIEADPACMRLIAEGVLMRLSFGERCFDRYAQCLQADQFDPPASKAGSLQSALPATATTVAASPSTISASIRQPAADRFPTAVST